VTSHRLQLLVAVAAVLVAACGANPDEGSGAPLLAYLDVTGQLRVVDTTSLEEAPFQEGARLVAPFAWSPNGQLIAASDGVDLWAGRPSASLERLTSLKPSEWVAAVAWTVDGLRVAYQVEGNLPRVEVVDRLSGAVTQGYPLAAELGGWWEPAGLDTPMLVVRDPRDRAVYLIDIAKQTRRRIVAADAVLPSTGGMVRFVAGGTRYTWTASEGPTPYSDVSLDPGVSLRVVEDGGLITLVDPGSGEGRTVGRGSVPVLQPLDVAAQHAPQAQPPRGRNLLVETTSFERGVEGWVLTGFNAPTVTVTEDDARYGDSAAFVTFGGEQSVFAVDLGEARPAINEREVTFSGWVRTAESGVHLRYLASNAEPQGGVASEPHPGDGEWHRLAVTFTPTFDVGGTTSYSIVGIRASGTGTALVDGVQVEYGATVTDYEPAADDPLSALPRGEPIPR